MGVAGAFDQTLVEGVHHGLNLVGEHSGLGVPESVGLTIGGGEGGLLRGVGDGKGDAAFRPEQDGFQALGGLE